MGAGIPPHVGISLDPTQVKPLQKNMINSTELTFSYPLPYISDRGIVQESVIDEEHHPFEASEPDKFTPLVQLQRQRLLNPYMFPRFDGPARQAVVSGWRRDNDQGLDLTVVEQLLIGTARGNGGEQPTSFGAMLRVLIANQCYRRISTVQELG
jgi:hypothetical protein